MSKAVPLSKQIIVFQNVIAADLQNCNSPGVGSVELLEQGYERFRKAHSGVE